jgi:hypothetical protein
MEYTSKQNQFLGVILCCLVLIGCSSQDITCDYTKFEILEENQTVRYGNVDYSYDIQFSDMDTNCINQETIKNFLRNLSKNERVKKNISSIRCFKSNGGGINDFSTPTGDNSLLFLIISDVDLSNLNFTLERSW